MPDEENKTPEAPKLQQVDVAGTMRQGQDMATDWTKRWQEMAPGMDVKELARIEGLKTPEQLALESQRSGIAGQLMSKGATGLMGDYMKYMRSQGMQVAAATGTPTSGFGQAIATNLGANQLLQNQLLGANLANTVLNYNMAQQQMAMMPSNALLGAGMPNQNAVMQGAMQNVDIANQQALMNYQVDLANAQNQGSFGKGILGGLTGAIQGGMAGFMMTGTPMGAVAGAGAGALGGGLTGAFGTPAMSSMFGNVMQSAVSAGGMARGAGGLAGMFGQTGVNYGPSGVTSTGGVAGQYTQFGGSGPLETTFRAQPISWQFGTSGQM